MVEVHANQEDDAVSEAEQVAMVPVAGVIQPRDGWMQVGCPTCGRVHEWAVSRAAELEEGGGVLCPHGGPLAAGRFTASADPGWTRVVPVIVMEAEVTPVSGERRADRLERAAVAAARAAKEQLHENIERMRASGRYTDGGERLVPWEELSDEVRERCVAPYRRIVAAAAEVLG